MNYDDAFKILIGHEGGLSDNKSDPGGLTKFGISQRSYPNLNIRDLTLDQAKAIYKRDYWDKVKADKLPPSLAFDVFDAAVNSGVYRAIKWLQEAAGVEPDGVIGQKTLRGIEETHPAVLQARYNGIRLEFMTELGTWGVFSRGWARRIAQNLQRV